MPEHVVCTGVDMASKTCIFAVLLGGCVTSAGGDLTAATASWSDARYEVSRVGVRRPAAQRSLTAANAYSGVRGEHLARRVAVDRHLRRFRRCGRGHWCHDRTRRCGGRAVRADVLLSRRTRRRASVERTRGLLQPVRPQLDVRCSRRSVRQPQSMRDLRFGAEQSGLDLDGGIAAVLVGSSSGCESRASRR